MSKQAKRGGRPKGLGRARKFASEELQTARLELRLPPALYAALQASAKASGVSASWIVKESLYKALRLSS